jgi:DNA-binding NarL/FixJ family response regulator
MIEHRLTDREQQIVNLLLQGCQNEDIAKELGMAKRTVKAHFNRLFLRFAIVGGVKRVKLATLLYRRQMSQAQNPTEHVDPVNANSAPPEFEIESSFPDVSITPVLLPVEAWEHHLLNL